MIDKVLPSFALDIINKFALIYQMSLQFRILLESVLDDRPNNVQASQNPSVVVFRANDIYKKFTRFLKKSRWDIRMIERLKGEKGMQWEWMLKGRNGKTIPCFYT